MTRQKQNPPRNTLMVLTVTLVLVIQLRLPMADDCDEVFIDNAPSRSTKVLRMACGITCVLGFLIMLGATGGCDNNTIPFERYIWLSILGLCMFIGGGYLGGIMQ